MPPQHYTLHITRCGLLGIQSGALSSCIAVPGSEGEMRVFLLHYYHIIHHSSPTWTSFTLCIDMHNIMMRRPAKSQFLVEKFCLSLMISSRRRHYIYTLMSQLETTTTLLPDLVPVRHQLREMPLLALEARLLKCY